MVLISVRRPSAALIVAGVALVAAVSGSALALPGKNTVQSNDIKKNAVKSKQLKNDGVKGKDVDEASLATVPGSENAASAAHLVGHTRIAQFVGEGVHTVATFGSFTVLAECKIDDGGSDGIALTIETSADGASLLFDGTDQSVFDVGDNPILLISDGAPTGGRDIDLSSGPLLAIAPDGATFTMADYFAGVNAGGQVGQCYVGGTLEQLR